MKLVIKFCMLIQNSGVEQKKWFFVHAAVICSSLELIRCKVSELHPSFTVKKVFTKCEMFSGFQPKLNLDLC